MRRSTSAVDDLPRLDVDLVPSRSHRAHGVEAVFHHVAVELHTIAVGVLEVQAARHVVLDGRLHLDADLAQLVVGRLQLLEAPKLPGRVMQAGLLRVGRLPGGQLEQRQVVVLGAEAQEDGAVLEVLVRDLEAEGTGVELLGFPGVANLQYEVAELAGLNHRCAPAPWRLGSGDAAPCSRAPVYSGRWDWPTAAH